MENHLNELLKIIPDLLQRKILDLGAGRGDFMRIVLDKGGMIEGVEPYDKYIRISKNDFNIEIKKGSGEEIPFPKNSFDFVNMTEVIEHVEDPARVMNEVYRVLNNGSKVYISVPNRFGLKDQHFNLYFVNWLPRVLSDCFISLFGRHKDYSIQNGRQRLKDMHYMTYGRAKKFFKSFGFQAEDIREIKIKRKFSNAYIRFVPISLYKFLRVFYFDSFHFLLHK